MLLQKRGKRARMKAEAKGSLAVWGRLEQGDDQTFILSDILEFILDMPFA